MKQLEKQVKEQEGKQELLIVKDEKYWTKIADTDLFPRKVTEKTREITKNYKPKLY